MKTFGVILETITKACLAIQQFIEAFYNLGAMTNDAMEQARAEAKAEFEAAMALNKPSKK